MKNNSAAKNRGRPLSFCTVQALQAAMRVFGEKGYAGTSLSDLETAMGITRPSIYAAFGNKEELFRKAVELHSQGGCRRVADCLASGTAREGVDRLLRLAVMMFTDPEHSSGCYVTQGPLTDSDASEETKRFVAERRSVLEVALRARFDRAIESRELLGHASPEKLARYYSVVMQGIALQAQHGGTQEQLLGVVDLAMISWPGT